MTPLQKMLIVGLGVVVLIWQFGGYVSETIFGPLTSLERRITTLKAEVQKKSDAKFKILKATRDLGDWNNRSLPPDRFTAATLYQGWLINLAEKNQLASVSVTPGQLDSRPKADTYYVIPATLKAEGTMKQLCDFLYAFHSSGLLQRVKGMKLATSKHQGDPTLELHVEVEGLAMKNSEKRSTIASSKLKPVELNPRSDYDVLTTKNLFVRGYNGPPPPPKKVEPPKPPPMVAVAPPKPAEPPFDAKEHTRLIASLSTNGQREAWLYDQSSNTKTILTEGSRFKSADLEWVLLVIADDFVRMQIAKDTYELALGQSLKEIRKLPAAATPMPTADPTPASPSPMPATTETQVHGRPAEVKPTDPQAAATPAATSPGTETKTSEAKPPESKPAEEQPAEIKPAEPKPAEAKPADPKDAEPEKPTEN